jgi:hypothetical protein
VPAGAQAEADQQPATAAEPAATLPITQPEEAVQLIRTGGGCVACPPGERTLSDVQGA